MDADGARLGRELSTEIVLYHRLVGERLGLSPADHKYLDLIVREAPVPMARVAAVARLSTGSATALVDRLERAGFVRRVADHADRRRVVVVPVPERLADIGKLMAPVGRAMGPLWGRLTADEAALVAGFLQDMATAMAAARTELAAEREAGGRGPQP